MWSIHTTEYYSAVKRKEILTYTRAWMNLEDILPSEISHHQKTNTVCFHLREVPGLTKFIEPKNGMAAKDGEPGDGERLRRNCLTSPEFQFCKMKRALGIDGRDNCTMM